jgi:hypothetical protein
VIETLKGELPEHLRATDAEMAEAEEYLKRQNPGATVQVKRRPGGAVQIWLALPEHGLVVTEPDAGKQSPGFVSDASNIPF